MLEDEATPRSPLGKTRRRLDPHAGRQGVASFAHWKMRWHLVRPLEDEASPRPCAGRQGVASVPCWKTRRASSSCEETRRRLIASFPRWVTHGTACYILSKSFHVTRYSIHVLLGLKHIFEVLGLTRRLLCCNRCVLLGVSCGANIADFVARKAVEAGKLIDPVKVVAQVLMYPFFIGSNPTHSEVKLANTYFYDKSLCVLAWKLFLPEREFSLDHPAANPLVPGRGPPLKCMPPTLTVVAEHDWMRDRAIAYSEELRKVNVDAPVLEYKDAVHEFATLDMLLKTPQAQACADDIAIWVKKYISIRGHEFSY
ncbi:hypothetical protein GW17_00036766 [Ensete ventricosum]|nr:hypothetical protein GW17_00036766 [Ensete ventricosum]